MKGTWNDFTAPNCLHMVDNDGGLHCQGEVYCVHSTVSTVASTVTVDFIPYGV